MSGAASMKASRSPQARARPRKKPRTPRSAFYLDVAAGRVLDHAQGLTGPACLHLRARMLRQPFRVVRPPRAPVLLRAFKPRLQGRRLFVVGPVLVLRPVRRIDDAGDMTGTGEHVGDGAAE